MFNNYFLKVNNVIYPLKYMVLSSYCPEETPIVTNEYYDGNYEKHIEYSDKIDCEIKFNIRQLYADDFVLAIAPFLNNGMSIEYFDPKTSSYKTGTFDIKTSKTPVVDRVYNGNVLYKELTITLTRRAAAS